MNLLQFAVKRQEYLERLIKEKERSTSRAPRGSLAIKPQRDRFYYDYIPSEAQGAQKRYLKTSNPQDRELARSLAQRDYDLSILRIARAELKPIARLTKIYKNGYPEELYTRLHEARRELVTPIRPTDEQYAAEWQARCHKQAVIAADATTIQTKRGEHVRSKSEVFIADALQKHDIKYHYECAVETIDHLTSMSRMRYPDFYVLNARTRKAYYWEHFGKCDDPDYVNDNINKLIDYRDVGIVQGVNLIMTFETAQIPFGPEQAESIIRQYLL